MRIVIKNKKLTLCPSKEKEDIQTKYEPQETRGVSFDAKEYAYADWEVSERKGNITELLQCVCDCCKYKFYTEQDILDFIEKQDDYKIEPNKIYYDSRAIDGTNEDTASFSPISHDTVNPQQIPRRNRDIPSWIEVHTSEKNDVSFHICFCNNISKSLGTSPYLAKNKNEPFELNTNNKYMILKACRVFAGLGKYKERIQNKLKICLDLIKIVETFGLTPNECEYNIDNSLGDSKNYSIYPKDKDNNKVIINKFPKDLRIFNKYTLSFKHCVFMFEEVEEKKYELSFKTRNDGRTAENIIKNTTVKNIVENPITFDACTFRSSFSIQADFNKKISFKNSIFERTACFDNSNFKDGVDFSGATFKENASFYKSHFGNGSATNKTSQNQNSFSNTVFEKEADFCESHFEQKTSFSNATFADFTDFSKAEFVAQADFSEAKFKDTFFKESNFKQYVSFGKVIFYGVVIFNNAKFQTEDNSRGSANFSGTHFQKRANLSSTFGRQANFRGAIFDENAEFENANFFNKAMFERAQFKKDALFSKAIFKQDAYFKNIIFYGNANFNNAKFQTEKVSQGVADFSDSRFKERAFFIKSHFHKKAIFSNVVFDHNAYFDDARFQEEANFKQSEFYANVHFYQTKFKNDREKSEREEPNFKQAIFNGYINLTDTKIFDFNFEQLKLEARTSSDAKGFRNIFKNIKNALIKDNNLLDASRFHKMELYAKELELEYKRKEEVKGFKCSSMLKFILSNGKDFVDEIQLYCYRLTSDHHTNLLMILNNVIFLIALFGVAKCILKHNYMSEALVCVAFVIISISFLLYPKFILEETYNKCSKIVNNNFIFILLYVMPAILLGYTLFNYYALSVCFLCVIFIFYALLYNTIIKAIALVSAYFIFRKRNFMLFLAYGMTIFMLFITPSSILPILGKLIENKSGEVCLFVVGNVKLLCCGGTSYSQTLNLIYMLFLFLLLWSLQKTARKNTIVPS